MANKSGLVLEMDSMPCTKIPELDLLLFCDRFRVHSKLLPKILEDDSHMMFLERKFRLEDKISSSE